MLLGARAAPLYAWIGGWRGCGMQRKQSLHVATECPLLLFSFLQTLCGCRREMERIGSSKCLSHCLPIPVLLPQATVCFPGPPHSLACRISPSHLSSAAAGDLSGWGAGKAPFLVLINRVSDWYRLLTPFFFYLINSKLGHSKQSYSCSFIRCS